MSRLPVSLLAAFLLVASTGCQKEPARPPAAAAVPAAATSAVEAGAVQQSPERGAVELLSARAILDDLNVANFEIEYRFTTGSPTKFYLCTIAFPGAEQWGVKPLESYEMSSRGVIRTGIEVGEKPVQEFEVTLSEADSPDQGFHLISNTLRGRVQMPDGRPANQPAEERD